MTTFITITNQKGGVGKSTTATYLAHALAILGNEVLLVDLDSQGQAGIALGIDPAPGVFNYLIGFKPLADCLVPAARESVDGNGTVTGTLERTGLTLLPGNRRSLSVPTICKDEGIDVAEVLRALGAGTNFAGFDYVVFDTPASGVLQEAAIMVADILAIPGKMEPFGVDGIAATLQIAERLTNDNGQRVVIIPTMYDARLGEHAHNLAQVREAYGQIVSPVIPQRSFIPQCQGYGETIWERKAYGAADVQEAFTALLQHMGLTNEEADAEEAVAA